MPQIHGVVEADFFDWVLEVPGGPEFVTGLAHRIARFDWSHVEHDVLKTLYESIISPDDRASLGEYYTPDWLADRIVAASVTSPLTTRVLDPACGPDVPVHAARRSRRRGCFWPSQRQGPCWRSPSTSTAWTCTRSPSRSPVFYLLAIGGRAWLRPTRPHCHPGLPRRRRPMGTAPDLLTR
jgi:hypothetical protein